LPAIINFYADSKTLTWFWISIGVAAGIPLLALVYLGSKLAFRYKSNNVIIGLSAFAIWVVAIIMLLSSSVGQVNNFKRSATNTNRKVIETKSDTINIRLADDLYGYHKRNRTRLNDMYVASQNGKNILIGKPEFDIEKSNSDEFEFVTRVYSKGKSNELAWQNAKEVEYNFISKNSLLILDQWFIIPEGSKYRVQEVELVLKVPVGKTVFIEEGMERIIHDIENTTNTWDGDMPGNFWTMKKEGLTLSK
jgi:hypothetical protein